MAATLIIVLLVLIGAWLFLRWRQATHSSAEEADGRANETSTEYHAVSIRFPNSACAAAKELDGRRFLSTAAPSLPLAECDVAECKCHYSHYADRRAGEDRRHPFGASGFGNAAGKAGNNRRESRDRRKDTTSDLFK